MQIDLTRFIESMYKYGQTNYTNAVVYALAEQGYKIDDEHHVVPVEEIKGNNGGISPKFKAGDWVVCGQYGAPCQIESIKDGRYYFTCGIGIPVESVNIDYHLWTIQDAKDGDVLLTKECEEPKAVFILKGNVPKNCVCSYYCYYNIMYPHFATDKEKGCLAPESMDLIPATKEQRATLMKAMADEGYTFDFDKKELKKGEKKPAWSEEDEKKRKRIMHRLSIDGTINNKDLADINDWFNSLKDRVQPHPKQEWSKEDENNIMGIDLAVKRCTGKWSCCGEECPISEHVPWLKSLKDRYTWKPSDEQMITLEYYMHTLVCNNYKETLFSLYHDLKKLRKE